MNIEDSVTTIKRLQQIFQQAELKRPMRVNCYDAGDRLTYDVSEVTGKNSGKIHLTIDKFVGGGFAGQVYRVKVEDITRASGPIGGLEKGGTYAMKILIPPTAFSLQFRNAIYWAAFQGPFQLQVNPHAARAGAI